MRRNKSLSRSLCRCIKHVRNTVRSANKEKAAIGICVRSVLQTKGKTVKRFRCGTHPYLQTQKRRSLLRLRR